MQIEIRGGGGGVAKFWALDNCKALPDISVTDTVSFFVLFAFGVDDAGLSEAFGPHPDVQADFHAWSEFAGQRHLVAVLDVLLGFPLPDVVGAIEWVVVCVVEFAWFDRDIVEEEPNRRAKRSRSRN